MQYQNRHTLNVWRFCFVACTFLWGQLVGAQHNDDICIALDIHRWLALDNAAVDYFGDLHGLHGMIGDIVNDCFGYRATDVSWRIKGKPNGIQLLCDPSRQACDTSAVQHLDACEPS